MGKSKKLNRKRRNLRNTMSGGQVPATGPAPGPAALHIYELEPESLQTSIQSFGDTLQALYETAVSDREVTETINSTITLQQTATDDLNTAIQSLITAFTGDQDYINSGGTSGTRGLYRALYGLNRTFNPPPSAPKRERIAAETLVPRVPAPVPAQVLG